ncbi:MAG TPA: acetylxylan esterase [Terrimicrobiaceae bacterium]|nr:acetylxylan esterase [Terrimicrobiaceae bacterium]
MSLPRNLRRLFPRRPARPHDVAVTGRCRVPHGERWTVEYSASCGSRVRALLLLPRKFDCPVPGIIASHQHAGQYHLGKSETAGLAGDPAMAYGAELCARGYVVLCPDHLGFEDRRERPLPGRKAMDPRTYEQFLSGDAILRGGSLAATYLFDLQQAVDVLQSFACVDARRIGVIGHSLGGQTALWLTAADRRIRAGFSSCGFSTMESIQGGHFPHNCAAYVPGLLQVGDIDDVAASIAPRALGMSHGQHDVGFPMTGVRRIHRRCREVFPDGKLLAVVFRGGHGFPAAIRMTSYRFLDAQLEHEPTR